jgi:lipid-A-disaccharide synthase
VRKIFPVMLAAAEQIRAERPQTRFASAAASQALADEMRAAAGDRCEVTVGAAHELMQTAAVGMVCSGTATLEASFFGLPMVILYKVAWLTWAIGKRLVRVPFLGMPNILAGRSIVPEFLQNDARPERIAQAMLGLLNEKERRERQQQDLAAVIGQLGEPGAGIRAAECILHAIGTVA